MYMVVKGMITIIKGAVMVVFTLSTFTNIELVPATFPLYKVPDPQKMCCDNLPNCRLRVCMKTTCVQQYIMPLPYTYLLFFFCSPTAISYYYKYHTSVFTTFLLFSLGRENLIM